MRHHRSLLFRVLAVIALTAGLLSSSAAAASAPPLSTSAPTPDSRSRTGAVHGPALGVESLVAASEPPTVAWRWPFPGTQEVVAPYRAPAHAYGAGHRGVDIGASLGAMVRAPAPGVVAFRGTVVDRPLLTIRHPGGLVSTFEPVDSSLQPGDPVRAGADIGVVATGGHAAPGTMHLGVRLDGDYINPMLLFGDVPRAVLLPCCNGS